MAQVPLWKTFILRLTSPHMRDGVKALRGSHTIRDLQWLLDGNNKNRRNNSKPFGDFYKGSYDGEYGTYTASAVRQAKWFLGYPDKQVDTSAGPTLQLYLRGERMIPLAYQARRKLRLAKSVQADTVRERAYQKAITKIGVNENPPYSNRTEFSYWYGIIGAWCAMFTSWAYVLAGTKRMARGSRYAYVPYVRDDAVAGRNGLHLTADPMRGDLVCYQMPGFSVPNHIGMFEKWIDRSRGIFSAVEGNTSMSSDDDGGEVMRRTRYKFQVAAFVRVLEP